MFPKYAQRGERRKLQKLERGTSDTAGEGEIIATEIKDMETITELVGVLKDLADGCGGADRDYAVSRPICAAVTAAIKRYKWWTFEDGT